MATFDVQHFNSTNYYSSLRVQFQYLELLKAFYADKYLCWPINNNVQLYKYGKHV